MLVLRLFMEVKQNLKFCLGMSFSGLLNIFWHDRDNAAHAFDVPKTTILRVVYKIAKLPNWEMLESFAFLV